MVTLCFAEALPFCVSSGSIIMTQVRWLQPSPRFIKLLNDSSGPAIARSSRVREVGGMAAERRLDQSHVYLYVDALRMRECEYIAQGEPLPYSAWLAQTLHLPRQVTGKVTLHYGPRLGIGGEIPLQRSNLPTHCANCFRCHCIHVGGDATKDEGGAYDVPRTQFAEDASISRDPHFPANDEQDGIGNFTAL
jgi:hypothetical protein